MLAFMFILGICMGSFYYVVGTRLVKGESLIKPGSHCEECKHALGILDLIPIVSYLFLGGKCRYCHKKISIKYIIFELFTGVLFALSYYKFGISYNFFIMLIISSLVVLVFITDFKEMIILDSPLIIAFVLIAILKFYYFGFFTIIRSMGHAGLSFVTMFVIGFIGKKLFKREALGGGDIKFCFVAGMILEYKYIIVMLILSTFLALPYAIGTMFLNKESELPFGPFLAGALFIIFFFMEKFEYIFYIF